MRLGPLRAATVALFALFFSACASRDANPSLDDYSDGVVGFALRWFHESLAGPGGDRAWLAGAPATGLGLGPGAQRWDLGPVSVFESRQAPLLEKGVPFGGALRSFVSSAFLSMTRHDLRVVGFRREGGARIAVFRPLLEGTTADGGTRVETGLWEVRLVEEGDGWAIASLRQTYWRSAAGSSPLFEERTGQAGLARAVHEAVRPMARRNVPIPGEHLPPGIAVLDFDGDGHEDFYVASGGGGRLFHNRGDGTFEEVSASAGVLGRPGVEEVGAISFDFDNDGWPDLYVTTLDGPNLLYRNRGDGTFEEVGAKAGVAVSDWCTSAVAFDYDRDGYADLYVLVYGRPERGPNTTANNAGHSHLFHNNGDGTFTEVTKGSGAENGGWGLAVAAFDSDEDGWPDLYVANDFGANILLHNQRNGTFRNVAAAAGVRDDGFGMGVAVADTDGDGHLDFYVSNYSYPEKWFLSDRRFPMPPFPYSLARPIVWRRLMLLARGSSLFCWRGPLKYERTSDDADVWDTSWSWGTVALDAFLRGRPDLFVVNGMVAGESRTEHETDFWNSMSRQWMEMEKSGAAPADFGDDSLWGYPPKRFYANLDGKRFADVAAVTGLRSEGNQRGVVVLDVNGDGAPDLLAAGFLQPPQLWVNRNPERNRALAVRLEGAFPEPGSGRTFPRSSRDALGALVRVEVAGLPLQTQVVAAGHSFLSSSSKTLFFGLGKAEKADRVVVRWPSGSVTELRDVAAGPLRVQEKD